MQAEEGFTLRAMLETAQEDSRGGEGFTLCAMLETAQEDSRGGDRQTPEKMRRKDNLFKCVVG